MSKVRAPNLQRVLAIVLLVLMIPAFVAGLVFAGAIAILPGVLIVVALAVLHEQRGR